MNSHAVFSGRDKILYHYSTSDSFYLSFLQVYGEYTDRCTENIAGEREKREVKHAKRKSMKAQKAGFQIFIPILHGIVRGTVHEEAEARADCGGHASATLA
jgi:hypothetical protein